MRRRAGLAAAGARLARRRRCGWRGRRAARGARDFAAGPWLGSTASGRACEMRARAGRWLKDEELVASGLRGAQRCELICPRRDSWG